MKKQTWLRPFAVLAAMALVVAACGGDDDDDDASPTEPTETSDGAAPEGDGVLKVGYLLPQTGALSFLGPPMIGGVEMAVEEINEAGGVLDADVELVPADDGTDPDVASAAADNLLADDVDVVVGAAASSVSLAVIDKLTGTPVVQCSPSNTGLQFTTYDDGGFYFRTAPPDNLQAQVLADLMVSDGVESATIVARSDEYGEGFANALRDELNNAGADAGEPILYDFEAPNFQAEAQQIADADTDAVALIAFDEGGPLISAAIAAGAGPAERQWYGTDGIQSSTFFEKVDPDDPTVVQGLRGTAPSAAPADGEATFRDRFNEFKPDTDTIYSGHAYDCVAITALAALVAGSDAPEAVAGEIVGVTKDGTKCTLFDECAQLIADGEDIDYDGAAGPLDFIDAGEPSAGAYDTWQFAADGSVEVIEESIPVS